MKKIKEYLDEICGVDENSVIRLKDNGHYECFGHWVYPKNYNGVGLRDWGKMTDEERNITPDHMIISINNEKVIVGNMSVNNKWSIYNYLDVYEHLPRGEPDENGYYQRSTEEEVIRYIDSYYSQMDHRDKKLKKIVSKINE